jgi:ABC-2 type transport system ATP-binding protein
MNDAAIDLRGIVKSYGKKQVLIGLDLAVPRGSVLGLLGTNGCGKTTLIKCALGLIRPQKGEARLLGEDSWTLSAEAKTRIGYVPQVVNLYPWMKVRHLIDYTAAFYSNWNHELIARLMSEWAISANDRLGPLSVGQLQKVAIMLALGHDPDLLMGSSGTAYVILSTFGRLCILSPASPPEELSPRHFFRHEESSRSTD